MRNYSFFIEFFIHFGFVVRPVRSLFLTNFILFSQHLHARVDPLCAPCDFRSVLFYSIHLSISFVCIKQPVATLVPCYKVSINATLISLPLFLCCLFFLFLLRLFCSLFFLRSVFCHLNSLSAHNDRHNKNKTTTTETNIHLFSLLVSQYICLFVACHCWQLKA